MFFACTITSYSTFVCSVVSPGMLLRCLHLSEASSFVLTCRCAALTHTLTSLKHLAESTLACPDMQGDTFGNCLEHCDPGYFTVSVTKDPRGATSPAALACFHACF